MAYNYYSEIDDALKKQAELALYDIDLQEQVAMEKIAQRRATALESLYSGRSGAYAEYAKAINPYGYNNEALYASGLGNAGKTETAKAGYFNAYTGLLSNLQKNYSEENQAISADEAQLLSEYNSKRNTAKTQAYNNMLEEYIRRYSAETANEKFEYQKQKDERDYQYKLAQAEYEKEQDERNYQYKLSQANKTTTTTKSSSSDAKKSTNDENQVTQINVDTSNLTNAEAYSKITEIFAILDQSVLPGEDNPALRIKQAKNAYLDVYKAKLTPAQYNVLRGLI